MEQIASVKLIEKSKASDFIQATSEVIVGDKPTGITIDGQELDAAVKVDSDRYILFTTDDVILEESLTVTLISLSQGKLESLQIGNEYSSGSFEQLSVHDEYIRFNFIGHSAWVIKVNGSPKLRLPFVSDTHGVKRSSGLKAYLSIDAKPCPSI
ncbi:hypothetical protein [Pantoea agglomerans]|uniref:hypothetical protein n=1 Tax=Enterobacter agglomerans TaxID=549 RepID=UPI001A90ECAE|nr:hypothetical protein [Pantoea agglomerans]MBO0640019.1 hypothetical protein [Pantoea agglomerans]